MRALLILFTAAAMVAAGPAAAGADDPRTTAERYFRTAERLFGAGDFVHAAKAFEDAYVILPLPAIAFSAAQAYRLAWAKATEPDKDAGQLRRAVELYRRYVDTAPQGERVVEATAALGDLEPLLARLAGAGKPAAPPPRTTGVTVTSSIAEVTVAIDGGHGARLPIVVELATGAHTLIATAAGYADRELPFSVIDGVLVPVEIDLDALPARVAVTAEAGSLITVDGRGVGVAPQPALALAAGHHLIAVTRRGRVAFTQDIEVGRGAAFAVVARQPSTGQRRAARWVLVGAGALTVGAGVAAALAVVADGDAAELATRRDTVGLTLAERDAYQDRRAARDDRRAWAVGLGAAALGVGVTGGLLFWFDQDLAGRAPAVVPTVSADGGGLAVAGRF